MSDSGRKASERRRENTGEKLQYSITVRRELADALADHYHDDPGVGSIPDALRQAGREIVSESGE